MTKINELEAEVVFHRSLYYNGSPAITDAQYDTIENELRSIDPKNETLNSIGETSWEGFEKVKHPIMMGSQEKIVTEAECIAWWNKRKIKYALLEHKLDGLSILLHYHLGRFDMAVTRGNGVQGDNITENVRKMGGVPEQLVDKTFSGVIRGEIVMRRSVFNTHYKDDYANPRNLASGIAKNKYGKGCENLNVIVYDAYGTFPITTEEEKIQWLGMNEFQIITVYPVTSPEELFHYRNIIEKEKSEYDVDIDGLVIKNNRVSRTDMARKRPQFQIAFKWEDDVVTTKVIGIEYSRNGYNYTPKAIVDPVEIEGTIVKKATLHNLDEVVRLGIYVGCTVEMKKAGCIIPKIIKVVS